MQVHGLRGAITKKKNGKIWEKFPIRLDPPPPSDNSELFEFQNFLKTSKYHYLKRNIEKKGGNVNMNKQTKVGMGVRLRLGLRFIILKKRKVM